MRDAVITDAARTPVGKRHHPRDQGIRYGLRSVCEGGGTADATILESL